LLLDGASARSRVLDTEAFSTAAIAAVLVDDAVPHGSGTARRRGELFSEEGAGAGCGDEF
jgi:hypothetical protein